MGEYALYNGQQIKIGTCEDLYYLRYDQRHKIEHETGSVNVMDADVLKSVRFRFPWPDEDGATPGSFEGDFERTIPVYGLKVPAGVEHHSIQFTANYPKCGMILSIPCPEGPGPHPVKTCKNGWRGDVLLVQQAVRNGKLVSIFQCGGCDAAFRIEELSELQEALAQLRKEGERRGSDFYAKVADRIEAGYREEVMA